MNEIPETIPWVTESFGSNDGNSDPANIRTPASTPGFETGLEKTFGIAISSSNAKDDTCESYAPRGGVSVVTSEAGVDVGIPLIRALLSAVSRCASIRT
jgi:hypothetical protein